MNFAINCVISETVKLPVFSVSKNSSSHRKLVNYCYASGKVVTLTHCVSAPANMLYMAKYCCRKLNFSCWSALSANFVYRVLFDLYLKYVFCVKRVYWLTTHFIFFTAGATLPLILLSGSCFIREIPSQCMVVVPLIATRVQ